MGRFFSGLAQAGAWACFDEFNRIDVEVLSVIAVQVLTLQQALKARLPRVVFEGTEIPLNPNYGCFVTMNPGPLSFPLLRYFLHFLLIFGCWVELRVLVWSAASRGCSLFYCMVLFSLGCAFCCVPSVITDRDHARLAFACPGQGMWAGPSSPTI